MFLLIDKPKGLSSHDVVNRVRRITGEKKVGHGGTLDPNATGLLIIGVGRESTRRLGEIAKKTRKTYEAEIFLGEERETDDVKGKVISKDEKIKPSKSEVRAALAGLVGCIEQIPPAFSAVKMGGKKAYELARSGKRVEMKPRKVVVYFIEVVSYDFPRLKMVCEVSSGTYIRAIARDLGRELGCGAYLKNLRRVKIGKYELDKAVGLGELTSNNWRDRAINVV